MQSTFTKINEAFYPLTHAVIDKLMKAKLTAAEWKLWAYLTKLDSWGDRYVDAPDTLIIMQELDISKATFYRAIGKLQKLGLFDFQDKGFAVRNLNCPKKEKPVSKMRQDSQKKDSETQKRDLETQKCDNLPSKPLPGKRFISSHTIQTYSDFIQTLSDSERENFEKYVREEWKRMTTRNGQPGEEIVSLERFLAREEDLQNWHQRFLKSPAGKVAKKEAIASTHDWRNDPRFDSWIWEAFNRGYEWIHENEAEREQRRTFCDWAHQVDAYEVCVKAIYGSKEVGA